MSEELKPCDFCSGSDIDYSMKTTGSSNKKRFHACMYCKKCRSYGPRVLTPTYKWDDFDEHRRQKTSEEIRAQAIKKWNTRATSEKPISVQNPIACLLDMANRLQDLDGAYSWDIEVKTIKTALEQLGGE